MHNLSIYVQDVKIYLSFHTGKPSKVIYTVLIVDKKITFPNVYLKFLAQS